MVDHQDTIDSSASPGELGASVESRTGFLSTTTGKLVVGGAALVLVLIAVGVALFFFVMGGALNGAVEDAVKPPPVSSGQESASATQTPVNPTQRSLASTFTFRNVFAPTVKKTFESTAAPDGSTDASTTDGGPSVVVPSDTLFLQSIISQDGEPMAVFIWNDQTYTIGENQQVGTTPWKVLQINADSVLMLFGDSQVTLSVGQGVGK